MFVTPFTPSATCSNACRVSYQRSQAHAPSDMHENFLSRWQGRRLLMPRYRDASRANGPSILLSEVIRSTTQAPVEQRNRRGLGTQEPYTIYETANRQHVHATG